MEEVGKKNNVLIIVLLILLIASGGFIVYDKLIKEEGSTSSGSNIQDAMSNELAIALVKEKLNMANNYLSDNTRYRGEQYSSGSDFYEYKPLDEFKKEFYSIYSSKLVYKDVLGEYDFSLDKSNSNLKNEIDYHNYAIKNNKVYVNSCTMGSAGFKRMGDYIVESITSDTIKVNYSIYMYTQEPGISDEEYKSDKTGKITLVKENGEWKIQNAVVAAGLCGNIYEVGK